MPKKGALRDGRRRGLYRSTAMYTIGWIGSKGMLEDSSRTNGVDHLPVLALL
jgi:hypothetical protein